MPVAMKILDDIVFGVDGLRFQHRIQGFEPRGPIAIISRAGTIAA
jgi:hypothetical protein